MNTNEMVWRQALEQTELQGASLGEMKAWAEKFFIPDNISPGSFFDNYQKLSDSYSFDSKYTPSLESFLRVMDRPMAFPIWFIAAYPDVTKWFVDEKVESLNEGEQEKFFEDLATKAFGAKDLDAAKVQDSEGHFKAEMLRAVIDIYKDSRGAQFECGCSEEMQIPKEVFDQFSALSGGGDNFQVIARMTTFYYKYLNENFKERFKDNASILATAGVLDAQHYVFVDKRIKIEQIVELANRHDGDHESSLINFMVEFESLLFIADSPEMSRDEIKNACQSQKEKIDDEIKKTLTNLNIPETIKQTTSAFMKTKRFSNVWSHLGISNAPGGQVDYDKRTKIIIWGSVIGFIALVLLSQLF